MIDGTRTAEIATLVAKLVELTAVQQPAEVPQPRNLPERVLLTVAEAAERLNLGKTKTYALVKSGEIKSVLIGRLRRIHVDSVNEYAARLVSA